MLSKHFMQECMHVCVLAPWCKSAFTASCSCVEWYAASVL